MGCRRNCVIAGGLWLSSTGGICADVGQKFEQAEKFAWRQNWTKAKPLYEQTAREYETKGDARAAAAARIGWILSRIYTASSKELLEELGKELQKPVVAQDASLQLRYWAAKAYLEEQPDLQAARQAWNQVQEIARRLGRREWESRASGHLGIFLWVIDIDSAGATRRVGQALVDAIKNNDLSAQVWFQANVGHVMCLMKRYEAAMNFYQKALTSASLDKRCPFPLDVYLGKARGLVQMGKPTDAVGLIDRVLQEGKSIGDHNAIAEALIVKARVLSAKDPSQAIRLLERGISVSEKNHFRRTLADALEEAAAAYLALGNLEKAEIYQAQCIEVAKSRHDGYSLPERFSRLAEIHIKRGRIAEAAALYDQVTDITEGLLTNSPSPYAKASLISWLSEVFVNHFKLLLNHLKDPRQAFAVLERARGRTIAEAIRSRLIEPERKDTDLSAENEEIAGLNSALLAAKSVVERKELLDRLFIAEQRMAPSIAGQNLYFRKVVPKPVSIEELQSVLRSDEVVLEFVVSEPKSYCLEITRNGLTAQELMGQSKLDTLIDEYLHEIRQKSNASRPSKELFSALLGRVENLTRYKRLTIVPDQNLHLVSFESLRDGQGRRLIESHVVSYVQSTTVLHLLRTQHPVRDQGLMLLALGDVRYQGRSGEMIQRELLSLEGAKLERLPATATEVRSIGQLFSGKSLVLTGESATEESLKEQRPLSRFKMLHFAVHGYADNKFPERSALVLTTKRNPKEDGLLQDREIMNLDLSAELVTLSACDSGFGKLQGQEGLSSLVKAFMIAGARTVVGSLWNVDDSLATDLMQRFYSNLAKGDDKGTALRDAKLALIKEHGNLSPHHWAGFTLWGDAISTVGLVE